MDPLLEVFWDSFTSTILSVGGETLFFAHVAFDSEGLGMLALAATVAATFGNLVNFSIGFGLRLLQRQGKATLSAERHARFSVLFNRYVVWLLLVPWMPFNSILAVLAGLFMTRLWLLLLLSFVGRLAYYYSAVFHWW